jgi:hypothetical protein
VRNRLYPSRFREKGHISANNRSIRKIFFFFPDEKDNYDFKVSDSKNLNLVEVIEAEY